jgi:hypothetical protein
MAAAAEWAERMREGNFEAAWRVGDALLEPGRGGTFWHLPRHQQPVWDGTPPDGRRVLVRCHHGLGDTIHFIRYAPLLHERASEVVVAAQPELISLLRGARGIDRLIPLRDEEPAVERDVDVELMELPHLFRTTLRSIPREVPYLRAEPPAPLARDGRLEVGVVWRAGEWDDRRSVPFPLVAPLADLPGIRLHVLQRGPGLRDRPAGWGVHSGSDEVVETARIMRALDLVISVDSMPAHLAGALGAPVWVLLHSDPDWRWMRNREDSPWYPTARLFRQRRPGEWNPVLERVAEELGALRDGTV